jgi:histidine ammonia-lyase
MGTNSANITRTVIENAYEVIAIELMALIQAVDYLKCQDRMSPSTLAIYNELRTIVPVFREDSPKDEAVRKMKEHIYNGDCEV